MQRAKQEAAETDQRATTKGQDGAAKSPPEGTGAPATMVSFWTCQDLLRDRSQRETPRLLTPAKKPGCDHLEGKTGEEQAQVLTVSELLSAFLHHEGGAGSVPGGGAKILHALLPKNQTIKQKQYWYKFNKKVKKKSPFHKQKVPSTAGLTH